MEQKCIKVYKVERRYIISGSRNPGDKALEARRAFWQSTPVALPYLHGHPPPAIPADSTQGPASPLWFLYSY